jgi:hypothetical protein
MPAAVALLGVSAQSRGTAFHEMTHDLLLGGTRVVGTAILFAMCAHYIGDLEASPAMSRHRQRRST